MSSINDKIKAGMMAAWISFAPVAQFFNNNTAELPKSDTTKSSIVIDTLNSTTFLFQPHESVQSAMEENKRQAEVLSDIKMQVIIELSINKPNQEAVELLAKYGIPDPKAILVDHDSVLFKEVIKLSKQVAQENWIQELKIDNVIISPNNISNNAVDNAISYSAETLVKLISYDAFKGLTKHELGHIVQYNIQEVLLDNTIPQILNLQSQGLRLTQQSVPEIIKYLNIANFNNEFAKQYPLMENEQGQKTALKITHKYNECQADAFSGKVMVGRLVHHMESQLASYTHIDESHPITRNRIESALELAIIEKDGIQNNAWNMTYDPDTCEATPRTMNQMIKDSRLSFMQATEIIKEQGHSEVNTPLDKTLRPISDYAQLKEQASNQAQEFIQKMDGFMVGNVLSSHEAQELLELSDKLTAPTPNFSYVEKLVAEHNSERQR